MRISAVHFPVDHQGLPYKYPLAITYYYWMVLDAKVLLYLHGRTAVRSGSEISLLSLRLSVCQGEFQGMLCLHP